MMQLLLIENDICLKLNAEEAEKFFTYPSLKKRINNSPVVKAYIDNITQVYVVDHENVLTPEHECFIKWKEIGLRVTVEKTSLKQRWPDEVIVNVVVPVETQYITPNTFLAVQGSTDIEVFMDAGVFPLFEEPPVTIELETFEPEA